MLIQLLLITLMQHNDAGNLNHLPRMGIDKQSRQTTVRLFGVIAFVKRIRTRLLN